MKLKAAYVSNEQRTKSTHPWRKDVGWQDYRSTVSNMQIASSFDWDEAPCARCSVQQMNKR
jgi:hypothetical protein